MIKGKCKNCGGDEGIHHYQTNQCPVGGREAPLNQKEEYMTTTFEADKSEEIADLLEQVKNLVSKVEHLEKQVKELQRRAR